MYPQVQIGPSFVGQKVIQVVASPVAVRQLLYTADRESILDTSEIYQTGGAGGDVGLVEIEYAGQPGVFLPVHTKDGLAPNRISVIFEYFLTLRKGDKLYVTGPAGGSMRITAVLMLGPFVLVWPNPGKVQQQFARPFSTHVTSPVSVEQTLFASMPFDFLVRRYCYVVQSTTITPVLVVKIGGVDSFPVVGLSGTTNNIVIPAGTSCLLNVIRKGQAVTVRRVEGDGTQSFHMSGIRLD